jgi:hypothetical protein
MYLIYFTFLLLGDAILVTEPRHNRQWMPAQTTALAEPIAGPVPTILFAQESKFELRKRANDGSTTCGYISGNAGTFHVLKSQHRLDQG